MSPAATAPAGVGGPVGSRSSVGSAVGSSVGSVGAAGSAVLDEVRTELVRRGGLPGAAEVAAAVRATGRVRGDREVLALVVALQAELTGAGPLQPLLAETGVTDVLVNAPDRVWVDRGRGLELTAVTFPDEQAVRRLAQRLAAQAGRRLDDASPWVDARLPDGARLHAVLPPVAVAGTAISLRVPPRRTFTLAELVAAGSFPAAGAALLRRLVRSGAGFLLSGGTGSGKTTLLSCLLGEVPAAHRIVVIEDSRELAPTHPHVVSLQARPPNVEGAGGVSLADLVRQALRMRPDRVVVGEVRGGEVVDLLAAMNTGHEGGCGTVHANSAADVPARIEALAGSAGLGRTAAHSQLAAALDVVVHLVREGTQRRVGEVHVVDRADSGLAVTVPAVTFGADGSITPGAGVDRLHDLLTRSIVPLGTSSAGAAGGDPESLATATATSSPAGPPSGTLPVDSAGGAGSGSSGSPRGSSPTSPGHPGRGAHAAGPRS